MPIDTERLIKDLRAGAEAGVAGDAPVSDLLVGMTRAYEIIAAALEDGVYDLEPKSRKIETVVPGQYNSDDLDRIVVDEGRTGAPEEGPFRPPAFPKESER